MKRLRVIYSKACLRVGLMLLVGAAGTIWAKPICNLVTFIPQGSTMVDCSGYFGHIHDVCQLLHDKPNRALDRVISDKDSYGIPLRVVNGVQAVPDDLIFVFVSGWAGWPGSVPYRYYGNAAYYAYLYQSAGIIDGVCVCYDHPDQTYTTATFGQKPDQDNLALVLDLVREANPHASIVLVGFSYGATTILNFISQQSHEKLVGIKAVVLESPFIAFEHVLTHSMSRYFGKRLSKKLSPWLTRWMPQYDQDAPTIIECAHDIPKHIPIMIGALKTDKVVHYKDSKKIARVLKHNGLPVEFYVDPGTQRHSYMSKSSSYAHAVNDFLLRVGL